MNKLIRIFRHLIHEFVVLLVPRNLRKNLMTCEEVSKILANENSLSTSSTFKLKIHLFICQCCTDYSDQLKEIDAQAHKLSKIELTPQQKESVRKSQKKILESLHK